MPEVERDESSALTSGLTLMIAAACGMIVANLYYAQPLVGPIGRALALPPSLSGLIVTVTQLGYCLGLLLIVPLADLLENRRLIVTLTVLAAAASLMIGLSYHAAPFMLAISGIGLFSVAVQILVPFAAHLAPPAQRGRAVGNVMSGLMFGIMMARPVASLVAELASWRTIFFLSAAVMAATAAMLYRVLPQRRPQTHHHYGSLLLSMAHLLAHTRVLQRRAFYHACLFGAFSLFWTVSPLLLAQHFGLSQGGIALFALVGVAGAISAPIAGRVADRGWTRIATLVAMAIVALAFAVTWFAPDSIFVFVLGLVGVAIDFGVTANLVLGQRALFILPPENRARLNGLYMAIFFLGGAAGSAIGGWAYARGGWAMASVAGCAAPVIAFLVCLTERRN